MKISSNHNTPILQGTIGSNEFRKFNECKTAESTSTSIILRPGDISEKVKQMQQLLNQWLKLTHPEEEQITPDSTFGPQSVALLKRFQNEQMGVKSPNGLYGPKTEKALNDFLKETKQNDIVKPANPIEKVKGLEEYFALRDGNLKIKEGDKGNHIGIFQDLLNRYRSKMNLPPLKVTNIFDSETNKAVKDFQQTVMSVKNPSGIVGIKTIRQLESLLQ